MVATGSRAAVPPIPGLDGCRYLTNETLFDLTELPERLIVLGGGPIGVELGQAFRRLGSEVVIIEAGAACWGARTPTPPPWCWRQLRADGVEVLAGLQGDPGRGRADADGRVRRPDAQV